MMIMTKDKNELTKEQYEQLIALLEESNDIQDKTRESCSQLLTFEEGDEDRNLR